MIPKKLHYCWFGENRKPKIFEACLQSWEHHCPDFEIIEWNETNAPNKKQKFYKDALRKKQYAFVSDSVRAAVLFEQGGIYLDTDMLLVKPIDSLLGYDFFSGEEVKGRVAYGFWGCVPEHRFLSEMVSFYDTTEFNEFSPPVITHSFKHLVTPENLTESEVIYPPVVFYPLPYQKRKASYQNFITAETLAVHLWDHSWKKVKEATARFFAKQFLKVCNDYLFYGYSSSYFKRYSKEFGRKLYHSLVS